MSEIYSLTGSLLDARLTRGDANWGNTWSGSDAEKSSSGASEFRVSAVSGYVIDRGYFCFDLSPLTSSIITTVTASVELYWTEAGFSGDDGWIYYLFNNTDLIGDFDLESYSQRGVYGFGDYNIFKQAAGYKTFEASTAGSNDNIKDYINANSGSYAFMLISDPDKTNTAPAGENVARWYATAHATYKPRLQIEYTTGSASTASYLSFQLGGYSRLANIEMN